MALDIAFFDSSLMEKVEIEHLVRKAISGTQLDMDEYDKLEPCWEKCRRNGINIGGYFDDTVIAANDVSRVLDYLRQSFGHIAQRKPFFHKDDPQETSKKMVRFFESAIAEKKDALFICD